MSNQQWNTGQGGDYPPQKPEGGAAEQPTTQHDWAQQQADWTQQGQTSATEWGQPQQPAAGQDWQQAQPQQGAGDWHQAQPQPSAGDWHQTQPQQQPVQDWNQQEWNQQQGWDQQQAWQQQQTQQQNWDQQAQQNWDQQQGNYPAGTGYTGQWQGGPAPVPAEKKPSPFDFGFKRASLPGSAGLIFLVGTIGIAVWWLFQLIESFSYVVEYPLDLFITLFGTAGLAVFGIMMLRAVLEVGVAAAGLLTRQDTTEAAPAEDTPLV
ncbi:DUF4282 domain-containing protein [Tessaracoccus sp. ZS01]|uniref:DUF4282 domain-containing protein n=1 Tax=Tessaracoccus sp. ZS01 TaxID=1906324 RepID=UPI00096C428A|nr:DUF4282 domain-containing protein [Tessaracoccus sp. ZS01]MCG6568012.1 hypothetical protein [Tessaracoccus sp. ZS01]OMG54274.1 hypothetical protein BJN44_10355 [Tessaracoccus sp. ZS01]